MEIRRTGIAAATAFCAVLLAAGQGLAAGYPDHTVTIVTGTAPGGTLDTVTRLLAAELSKKWGQPVVVENREGAGHSLAAAYVAKAKPDGYTLLSMNTNLTAPNDSRKKAGIDAAKSFAPVTQISQNPHYLVVNTSSNINTAQELVDGVKKKPDGATYGSTGVGSLNSAIAERLAERTGMKIRPIVYKGGGEIALAILRNEVDFITNGVGVLPHVQSGALKLLAITSDKRAKSLPDVPTIAEALNLPGFNEGDWQGLITTKGTPPEVIDKIQVDLAEIAKDPGLQAQLEKFGGTFIMNKPAEFGVFLTNEVARSEGTEKASAAQ